MKWLIILLIILIPIVLVAVRYRQQLLMGWQMWQMYKRMKQPSQPQKQVKQRASDKSEQLIRCERCGTWVAQSEALKLRSKTVYCSTNCMERAAKLQSLVD